MPLLVQYSYGSLEAYNASTKHDGTLFFTEDTNQLFKGDKEITKTARVVDALPDIVDADFGVIYIKTPEYIPYVFAGSGFVRCMKEYTSNISDQSTDDQIPTAKSVHELISSLGTVRTEIDVEYDDAEIEMRCLPDNGSDILYSGHSVRSIDFDILLESSDTISDDYWVRIVFKKGASATVRELLPNENIKLLNPDMNLSNYTTIHLLLIYDGFNVCCIAGGYE